MKKGGFGLLEIVIAVSLISGTIFSLAFVFLLANKLETHASNQIRANIGCFCVNSASNLCKQRNKRCSKTKSNN